MAKAPTMPISPALDGKTPIVDLDDDSAMEPDGDLDSAVPTPRKRQKFKKANPAASKKAMPAPKNSKLSKIHT